MFSVSDYLHPRFWPSWLGFGVLRLLSLLPVPVLAFMGVLLGNTVYALLPSRRRIAAANVAHCFPELSQAEQKAIVRRCFQLVAQTTLCMGINWWSSPERIKRLVSYEGKEHYDEALASGNNIILLAPHAIGLEMGGLGLSVERPMITMYQHTKKPLLNNMVKAKRGRFDGFLVERREPLRTLLKLIRQGHPFYYLPDQDAGAKGVFAPFFGVSASTHPMLSKFAKVGNAVVLPIYTRILPGGKGWHAVIGPAIEDFPGPDELVDTARMNKVIEDMVRTAPEQYFWVHKRFKTRPDGEASLY